MEPMNESTSIEITYSYKIQTLRDLGLTITSNLNSSDCPPHIKSYCEALDVHDPRKPNSSKLYAKTKNDKWIHTQLESIQVESIQKEESTTASKQSVLKNFLGLSNDNNENSIQDSTANNSNKSAIDDLSGLKSFMQSIPVSSFEKTPFNDHSSQKTFQPTSTITSIKYQSKFNPNPSENQGNAYTPQKIKYNQNMVMNNNNNYNNNNYSNMKPPISHHSSAVTSMGIAHSSGTVTSSISYNNTNNYNNNYRNNNLNLTGSNNYNDSNNARMNRSGMIPTNNNNNNNSSTTPTHTNSNPNPYTSRDSSAAMRQKEVEEERLRIRNQRANAKASASSTSTTGTGTGTIGGIASYHDECDKLMEELMAENNNNSKASDTSHHNKGMTAKSTSMKSHHSSLLDMSPDQVPSPHDRGGGLLHSSYPSYNNATSSSSSSSSFHLSNNSTINASIGASTSKSLTAVQMLKQSRGGEESKSMNIPSSSYTTSDATKSYLENIDLTSLLSPTVPTRTMLSTGDVWNTPIGSSQASSSKSTVQIPSSAGWFTNDLSLSQSKHPFNTTLIDPSILSPSIPSNHSSHHSGLDTYQSNRGTPIHQLLHSATLYSATENNTAEPDMDFLNDSFVDMMLQPLDDEDSTTDVVTTTTTNTATNRSPIKASRPATTANTTATPSRMDNRPIQFKKGSTSFFSETVSSPPGLTATTQLKSPSSSLVSPIAVRSGVTTSTTTNLNTSMTSLPNHATMSMNSASTQSTVVDQVTGKRMNKIDIKALFSAPSTTYPTPPLPIHMTPSTMHTPSKLSPRSNNMTSSTEMTSPSGTSHFTFHDSTIANHSSGSGSSTTPNHPSNMSGNKFTPQTPLSVSKPSSTNTFLSPTSTGSSTSGPKMSASTRLQLLKLNNKSKSQPSSAMKTNTNTSVNSVPNINSTSLTYSNMLSGSNTNTNDNSSNNDICGGSSDNLMQKLSVLSHQQMVQTTQTVSPTTVTTTSPSTTTSTTATTTTRNVEDKTPSTSIPYHNTSYTLSQPSSNISNTNTVSQVTSPDNVTVRKIDVRKLFSM